MKRFLPPAIPVNPMRRRFIQGLAGVCASGAAMRWTPAFSQAAATPPAILTGTEFALEISETPVNFTGRPRMATTVNGQIPGPTLRWREGDEITLRVTNRMRHPTSIHWHGILLPFQMDGVPGISFDGIAPGETFVYRFKVKQSGTYWYHSHSHFQEQTGLYGPIVIDPREPQAHKHERDYVVMLSDWSDENPDMIYRHLKQASDYYSYVRPTAGDFIEEARHGGFKKAWESRAMWDRMRMSPRDLSDVSGATYTFLSNGATPAANWSGLFRPGEKVRLRFINGSASTFFDVRIPGLKMTVVAADGQDVEPVTIDEFRIGVAETYDVVVAPTEDRAYTIFSQAIDRSGYARATLTPRPGMQAEIPALDPVPTLTMADMGMGDMDMGDMGKGASGSQQSHAMHASAAGDTVAVEDHAAAEFGPGNSMRADGVSTRLDDPGPGLRGNGRKVLTYADLHTTGGSLDAREPAREIVLHLTGNMDRFMWSFNGKKYAEAEPILLHYGERLRIVLINDTMMNHPIHLHGMWSELESADGNFQVRKHTITVQPGHRVSYRVTADAPGRWAYHCHLLYHMEAGMFRAIVVE